MATFSPRINGQSKAGRNTKKMQKKTWEAWEWTQVREYKHYSRDKGMTNQTSTKLTGKKPKPNQTKKQKNKPTQNRKGQLLPESRYPVYLCEPLCCSKEWRVWG